MMRKGVPKGDREKGGLIEVRGRLMNLTLSTSNYKEPITANTHYLLHNGLSSGDSLQLFIIFNYSILTVSK